MLGAPVQRVMTADARSLGAAMLAAVGIRAVGSLEDGISAMVSVSEQIDPQPAVERAYEARIQRMEALQRTLATDRAETQGNLGQTASDSVTP